jgi:hypothetical protein
MQTFILLKQVSRASGQQQAATTECYIGRCGLSAVSRSMATCTARDMSESSHTMTYMPLGTCAGVWQGESMSVRTIDSNL